ncbi:hypothetical protein [Noviluteimonas dokdonensis]|nr:hypothetical protein [Lysobacter dokdonensis]
MQRLPWWVLLLSSSELFRCVSSDGAVSYQDTACAAGSRLTRTIALPESRVGEGSEEKPKAAKNAKPKSTKSGGGGAKPAKADKRTRQRQACVAARAEEQRVLDGLGLERTFEQLRALGDKVQAACKGV